MRNKLLLVLVLFGLTACNTATEENKQEPVVEESQDLVVDEEVVEEVPEEEEIEPEEEIEDKIEVEAEEIDPNQSAEAQELFNQIADTEINSIYEDSPQLFTRISFTADGKFDGFYFGTTNTDGYDAGLNEIARNVTGFELHESEFVGQMEFVEKLDDKKFKLKLTDLEVTSEVGVDEEMPFKAHVDFVKQFEVGDEFIIYLDGAYVSPEERAGTIMESQFYPHYDPYYSQIVEDHALGLMLYNQSQDVLLKIF